MCIRDRLQALPEGRSPVRGGAYSSSFPAGRFMASVVRRNCARILVGHRQRRAGRDCRADQDALGSRKGATVFIEDPASRSLAEGLVGRSQEWELLLSRVDKAAGQGGALLLSGEPAIGKSVLLSAAEKAATAAGTLVPRAEGVEFPGRRELLRPGPLGRRWPPGRRWPGQGEERARAGPTFPRVLQGPSWARPRARASAK